jgi:hypothetical protein
VVADSLLSVRDGFLDDLERQLMGPVDGEREIVRGRPFWRYLAGMLFPGDVDALQSGADAEQTSTSGDESDPAVSAAYDRLPSSMGVSFLVLDSPTLEIAVQAARYERSSEASEAADPDEHDEGGIQAQSESGTRRKRSSGETWCRVPLGGSKQDSKATLEVPQAGEHRTVSAPVLQGLGEIVALFRARDRGHLVTVTLVNRSRPKSEKVADTVEATLFQCRMNVRTSGGGIVPYPRSETGARHEEDEELDFVYRNHQSYGIGHGCAASWNKQEASAGKVRSICADPLPRIEVRGMTNKAPKKFASDKALDIGWLADAEVSRETLGEELRLFVERYDGWVKAQAGTAKTFTQRANVAMRIVARQRQAVDRMLRGIDLLLSDDDTVLRAFRMAQRAILGQFIWNERRGDELYDIGAADAGIADKWISGPVDSPHRWHPFQLAFQLLVLESVVSEESPERDLVDLLWFPTGGGKTEAYLAVAAFEMFRRRLRYQDHGTAVVMRYTLRLLTSQQFERCASLISAMEVLRRVTPELGEESFRLGLWVGDALTPNRLDADSERSPGAKQRLEALLDAQEPENPFLLGGCPRCGTRIVPRFAGDRSNYGIEATASHFRVFCPDTRCELHENIPVSVVDEDLFRQPPTFVIGTIDKFARLAWDARPRSMFGTINPSQLPPSLIIQDELHLITGPLGTIAGGYEVGFESVIRLAGIRPKYLASTATIQRADDQCRSLYGRHAFLFPPPGLDADDSFFSRTDDKAPGRTFVGVMGTGPYSSLTTLVQVSAAAAFAGGRVRSGSPGGKDSYWTQVIYHNSKQELGKTTTMLRDDVKTRLDMLQSGLPVEEARRFEAIEELSANLKGGDVGRALERLNIAHPDPASVDAVACTNMLSVGVDVGRLGLMIMKGQPKTTAEYIQSTSRVGRDARRRPPGVVVALYSPFRPRDRSHFEDFQAFHGALYRAVEPSSVTPFADPARRRTLHAALVIAMRMGMGWEDGRDASLFDTSDPVQRSIVEELRERVKRSCGPDEVVETVDHFDRLLDEWAGEHDRAKAIGVPLSFDAHPQFTALLDKFPASRAAGRWPTLNSMRHVDGETPFVVRGTR